MKTVILNISDKQEKWFEKLLEQLRIRHKVLSNEDKADLVLAKLIDEAMEEEGEVAREQVLNFVKKYAD